MSLLTPDFGLVFWMLVTFLAVLFILGKFAWPAITEMIAKRNQYIEDSIQSAKEANEKLQNIKAEADKILSDAKSQQLQIVHDATKVKEEIISEAKRMRVLKPLKLLKMQNRASRRKRIMQSRKLRFR